LTVLFYTVMTVYDDNTEVQNGSGRNRICVVDASATTDVITGSGFLIRAFLPACVLYFERSSMVVSLLSGVAWSGA